MNTVTRPFLPLRPVRPALCLNFSMVSGISYITTSSTSKSMPRSSSDEHTSTSTPPTPHARLLLPPSLNARTIVVRTGWGYSL